MSETIFEGPVKGPGAEVFDTTITEAACGGLLVIQEALSGGDDQVILSDEACAAVAKYIRGYE